MGLLPQMGENQPLPAAVQVILRAAAAKDQAAAPLPRLQQQPHLGVVAQGLIVAHPLHGVRDGLPVDDAAWAEGHRPAKAALHHLPEDLQLDRAHKLDMDLPKAFIPHDAQQRVLLLQLAELPHGGGRVHPLGQVQPVAEGGGEDRGRGVLRRPQTLTGESAGKAGDSADRPRLRLLQGLKLLPGVAPQLVRLLLPGLPGGGAGEEGLHPQNAAGDLQEGQPLALAVPTDLEHPGGELRRVVGAGGVFREAPEKCLHPLELQG